MNKQNVSRIKNHDQTSSHPTLKSVYKQLHQANAKIAHYQTVFRLANVEIKRRSKIIRALTTFTYQSHRITGMGKLLQLALSSALDITKNQAGAIILIDTETQDLSIGYQQGLNDDMIYILTGRRFDAGASILMPHLVMGNAALLESTSSSDEEECLLLTTAGLNSLVSVPIQVGNNLLGALLVGTSESNVLDPADLYFLMGLSQETATAIESLHLRDRLWHFAERLLSKGEKITLDDVRQNGLIVKTNNEQTSTWQNDLATITTNLNGKMSVLFVLHPHDNTKITLAGFYGVSLAFTSQFSSFSLSDGLFPYEKLLNAPLIVNDLDRINKNPPIPLIAHLQKEGAKSLIAGRLQNTGKKTCIAVVASDHKNAFRKANLRTLVLSGNKLLSVLNQAQLPLNISPPKSSHAFFDRQNNDDLEYLLTSIAESEKTVQRQSADLAALNEVLKIVMHTNNLDKILNQVLPYIVEILDMESTWIYLVDYDSKYKQLKLHTTCGLSRQYERGMRTIPLGDPIEGSVAAKNQACFIEDITTYFDRYDFLIEKEELRAIAAIPLSGPDENYGKGYIRVVGVLGVALRQPYLWTKQDIDLLNAIGNQIGLAINNVYLYDEAKLSITMLSVSNQILQGINDQLLDEKGALQKELDLHKKKSVLSGINNGTNTRLPSYLRPSPSPHFY